MWRECWKVMLSVYLLAVSGYALALPDAAQQALDTALVEAGLFNVPHAALQVLDGEEPDTYQVKVGSLAFLLSADGSIVMPMSRTDVEPTDPATIAAWRRQTLAWLDESEMIVFEPPVGIAPRYTLSVFTDVNCPFSRDFHQGVAELNAAGVRVRYLAYPRDGLDSPGRSNLEAVWCQANRRKALDQAMRKRMVFAESCVTPVSKHYAIGESFAIDGTPALILEDGTMLMGNIQPTDLLQRLAL